MLIYAYDWNDKLVWCILESSVRLLDNDSKLEADEIGFVEIIRFKVSMYLCIFDQKLLTTASLIEGEVLKNT